MAKIKLTKNELRAQQKQEKQLKRYLPTLQLKKAMLQSVVNDARQEIAELEKEYAHHHGRAEKFAALLTERTALDPQEAAVIDNIGKHRENIAGVDVPIFESISFKELTYSLFETPPWLDGVVAGMRQLVTLRAQVAVVEEKKRLLEEELRQVSIRVNLFEKVLIPRAIANIKKIKVFLGDQELAAVGQAKVAKTKIEERRESVLEQEEALHAY